MDQGENDLRFCVYVHKDKDGNVRYVGSGVSNRPYDKVSRNKAHLDMFDELTAEVITGGLTKTEALRLERELYFKYANTNLLLNVKEPVLPTPLSYSFLSQYFYYDETSPSCLRWKVDNKVRGNSKTKRYAGDTAGYRTKNGYYELKLQGKSYKSHRIIWVLCNKRDLDSTFVIDHIDCNRANNKIENLRLISFHSNTLNKSIRKDNKTGVPGVKWEIKYGTGRWIACWRVALKEKSKAFNPKKLYPDLQEDEAVKKAFDDAVEYRRLMVEKHYLIEDLAYRL